MRCRVEAFLQSEAERRRMSLEALANNWLEDQLWQERHKEIYDEAKRFKARHAELLARYAGRYVAMRDGVVIDDDADLSALHGRVRAQYGDEAVLIAPVTPEPIQTIRMLGSRRKRP
jgi:hypothetical protein